LFNTPLGVNIQIEVVSKDIALYLFESKKTSVRKEKSNPSRTVTLSKLGTRNKLTGN